jgi:TRAP-type mannitol/chloroaromatic compound transport system permease small subunit
MSTATPASPPPSLGKLLLRRGLIDLALIVMMLVPMIVLLVIIGQPARRERWQRCDQRV